MTPRKNVYPEALKKILNEARKPRETIDLLQADYQVAVRAVLRGEPLRPSERLQSLEIRLRDLHEKWNKVRAAAARRRKTKKKSSETFIHDGEIGMDRLTEYFASLLDYFRGVESSHPNATKDLAHEAEDMVRVFSQISLALDHGDSPLLTRIEGIVDEAADAAIRHAKRLQRKLEPASNRKLAKRKSTRRKNG